MIKPPYFTAQRVFPSDNGFSYRIQIWQGDVDYLHEPPNITDESKKVYKTGVTATRAMLARLTTILTELPVLTVKR